MSETLETKAEQAFASLLGATPLLASIGFLFNDSEVIKDVKTVISVTKGSENVPFSNVWNLDIAVTAKSRVKRDGQGPDRLDTVAAAIEGALDGRLDAGMLHERLSYPGVQFFWSEPQSVERTPSGDYNVRQFKWRIIARNT